MLLTKDQNPQRTESTCICGRKIELISGTRPFFIGTRQIFLHNVPHFYCSHCEKATYDSTLNIDQALKHAYKYGLDEIDWNNRDLYI